MTKEYLVEVKVKNNWMAKRIKDAGHDTIVGFCRKHNLSVQIVGKYLAFRETPIGRWGNFKQSFVRIANALKCLPEDLCPPQHLEKALKKNKAQFEASSAEVAGYLSGNAETARVAIDKVMQDESSEIVNTSLRCLLPREERVIRLRYGFGGKELTLEETGVQLNITRERVRQIEARALRRLKHPDRSRLLREASEDFGALPMWNRDPAGKGRFYIPEWKKEEQSQKA